MLGSARHPVHEPPAPSTPSSTPRRSRSSARPRTRASGATGWPRARCAASPTGRRYLVNHRAATILGRRAYRVARTSCPRRPSSSSSPCRAPRSRRPSTPRWRPGRGRSSSSAPARAATSAATTTPRSPQRVRDAGAVLLGPNCLGVLDSGRRLELVPNPLPAGAIGLISQSGNLALELGLMAAPEGLGFSRFASLGNQADLGATELDRRLRRPRRHRGHRRLHRGLPRRPGLRARRRAAPWTPARR